jgi:glutamate-1-semialdehyde aminotransferase
MPAIVLTEEEGVYDFRDVAATNHETYSEIISKLFEKGVMPELNPREPLFISSTHSDSYAEITIGAFEEAVIEVIG